MIIRRDVYAAIEKVMEAPEAVVITGMRRVGKTTLLRYIMQNLPSRNHLYLDMENPAHQQYFDSDDYERILDRLKFLGLSTSARAYVFLDEIHLIPKIPSVVKYLMDHYPVKFIMTGSASFYLKNLFSESLSGRKYVFELFPLSFNEFLAMRAPELNMATVKELSPPLFETLDRHYEEFLLYGGFPGVVAKESPEEKHMMLDDILSSYYLLEVRQLGDFRKTHIMRDLIMLLIARPGTLLEVQKLSSEMGIARETLLGYLSFFEQTYLISLIHPFSSSKDRELRRRAKVYMCDTGLMQRFGGPSPGAMLENAVFCALRNRGEVNYYQKKQGGEIDFIVGKSSAYEVKNSVTVRDVSRLRRMCQSLGIEHYTVVSRRYSSLEPVTYGFLL
jgi:predicted AAA+ superfamily ATPase